MSKNSEFKIVISYSPKGRASYKVYHPKSNTYPFKAWNQADCQTWINNHDRTARMASSAQWGLAALRREG